MNALATFFLVNLHVYTVRKGHLFVTKFIITVLYYNIRYNIILVYLTDQSQRTLSYYLFLYFLTDCSANYNN